jgi:hypothetical protein
MASTGVEMYRDAQSGPAVPLNRQRALAAAQEILSENADLLGLERAVFSEMRVSEDCSGPSSGPWDHCGQLMAPFGMEYVLETTATIRPPPGFEGAESLQRKLDVEIGITRDGQVAAFEVFGDNVIPAALRMDATTGMPMNDPRVLGAVIGQHVYVEEEEASPYGYPTTYQRDLGAITRGDIHAVAKSIHVGYPNGIGDGEVYTLAYEVQVAKGGEHRTFFVDAVTGRLLNG